MTVLNGISMNRIDTPAHTAQSTHGNEEVFDTEQKKPPAPIWRRLALVGGGLALVLALLVVAVLEGDLPDLVSDVTGYVGNVLPRYGLPAAFVLLFLEESGVPMPMPGDVFVMYVGHQVPDGLIWWCAAWLGLIICSTTGSTILYLISRRWGPRIATSKLALLLHLTPARLDRAGRWFLRWGPWAIIFGRHVPGLRVPVTVVAGVFQVRYAVFAASVAVSTGIWAAFFLFVGIRYGERVEQFLALHRGTYRFIPLLLVAALIVYVVLRIRQANTESR